MHKTLCSWQQGRCLAVREQVSPVWTGRWAPFSKFGSLTFETYFIIIIIIVVIIKRDSYR